MWLPDKARRGLRSLLLTLCVIGALSASAPMAFAHSAPTRTTTPNYVPCSSLGAAWIVQKASATLGNGAVYVELWEVPDAVTNAPCRWYAHAIESGGPSGTLAAYLMDTGTIGNCNSLATAASVQSSGTNNVYTSHVSASLPVEAQTVFQSKVVVQTPCVS